MAYFVCLDTCVLVTLYLKLRSGSEAKGFNELKALIEAKDATLLVPQITLLELQKFVDEAERELFSTVARIETQVGNEGKHVKDDLAKALAEPLETWRKKKAADMRAVANRIVDWLKSGKPIKFTQEIAHETRCRIIAGKFPKPKGQQQQDDDEEEENKNKRKKQKQDRRDQDCFIIDSLISHIGSELAGKYLLFATTDNGFGGFPDDGTGPLDDTFQAGLPPARIFNDLSKLVAFVKDKKTITLPTQDEVEAEKKREIEQEIKLKQEATAEVVRGYTLDAKPGRFVVAGHPAAFVPGGIPLPSGTIIELIDPDSVNRANQYALLRHLDQERRRRNAEYDQPPSAPPNVPIEGLQTFNGDLGDEEPKTEPKKKPEADDPPNPS